MFNEKTMPVQLRDFRDQLLAQDEGYAELHGDLLEEDLGDFYRGSRTAILAPRRDERFYVAYLQVSKANSLWRVGRWDEAAAAVSKAIAAFEAPPVPKGRNGEVSLLRRRDLPAYRWRPYLRNVRQRQTRGGR